MFVVFFFKQRSAYEMRISDWSSDVCSSVLVDAFLDLGALHDRAGRRLGDADANGDGVGGQRGGRADGKQGGARGGNEARQLHGGLLLQERACGGWRRLSWLDELRDTRLQPMF